MDPNSFERFQLNGSNRTYYNEERSEPPETTLNHLKPTETTQKLPETSHITGFFT